MCIYYKCIITFYYLTVNKLYHLMGSRTIFFFFFCFLVLFYNCIALRNPQSFCLNDNFKMVKFTGSDIRLFRFFSVLLSLFRFCIGTYLFIFIGCCLCISSCSIFASTTTAYMLIFLFLFFIMSVCVMHCAHSILN